MLYAIIVDTFLKKITAQRHFNLRSPFIFFEYEPWRAAYEFQ
jgi:hypothetical protein